MASVIGGMLRFLGVRKRTARWEQMHKSAPSHRNGESYLIEFRFHSRAKRYINELCKDLSQKFRIKRVTKKGKPPHISLYGGFTTKDSAEVLKIFTKLCKDLDIVKFKLNGFSHIENHVIHIDVEPSDELAQFRWELAQALNPICDSQLWDKQKNFIFHATLAFKGIESKFDDIWSYLHSLEKPEFSQYLLRVTLIKNHRILKEYDLIQRLMFRREEALSKKTMRRTIELLKEIKANGGKRETIEFVEKKQPGKKVFLISDLHLDHENIIKFCHRPFKDAAQMNKALVDNWNRVVRAGDTVYFLGDMAFGKGSRTAHYWLKKLNGNVVFIEGNHEDTGSLRSYPPAYNYVLKYEGREFLLMHDPAHKPKTWNDWIIHGHHHNNLPEYSPLINREKKKINVSAEMVDYTPIELDELMRRMPAD